MGVQQLEQALDVKVVPTPHALRDPEWLAQNPRARADDLMAAFEDRDTAAIISTIGGDDSIRLLPFLDLDIIRSHPKIVLGYSDTTITHMACLRAGLVTFYGPAIMAGFAENGGIHPYMLEGVRRTLVEPEEPPRWPENVEGWTAEHLDWHDPANQDRPRTLRPSDGWRWFGGETGEGPIVAGCLEVLDWLRGTEWWPDLEGAVLAIETSEEQPPPELVRRFLRSLASMGVLQRLAALLFGRPGGADLDPAEHASYDEAMMSVVRHEQGLDDLTVVTGVDFGHTDPMWTIPIGVPARVDPHRKRVDFLPAGVL